MVSISFLNKAVGTTSKGLEEIFIDLTRLVRSSSVIGEKFSRVIGWRYKVFEKKGEE